MSKYDRLVQNDEEVHGYLERMVENAKQKGIMITAVFVNSPIIDRGCDCITPYGRKHPELVIRSCAKVGLEMVDLVREEVDLE